MAELITRHTLDVDAPVSTLWKVLTNNEFIQKYMFGCLAETDWKPDSPLLWKGAADGKVYVKGSIVSINPPYLLSYTIIDPNNASIPDIPENYLTVTYTLRERGPAASTLEITQGNYAMVAKGQERYKDSANSGGMILQGIKKLAEDLAGK
jgi:uncharacterized protein YndB with AHSA1/START domain